MQIPHTSHVKQNVLCKNGEQLSLDITSLLLLKLHKNVQFLCQLSSERNLQNWKMEDLKFFSDFIGFWGNHGNKHLPKIFEGLAMQA